MKDDVTAATKDDLKRLEAELKVDFQSQFQEFEARILRHFDLAVEKIRHDLLGVNRDELEVMKDRQQNHEQRITRLERSGGLVRN